MRGEKFETVLNYSWKNKPLASQLIQDIIDKRGYTSYLEIGTEKNVTFDKIKCDCKVGCDPKAVSSSEGEILKIKSDQFFKDNNATFDCIFVDGLHVYDQVRRDIVHSLEVLNEGGLILVHDSFPLTIGEQAVPQEKFVWTGDVWKAIVEVRTRPDLDSAVCLIDYGVALILKRVNTDQLSMMVSDFNKLSFSDYVNQYSQWLRPIEYDDVFEFILGRT